MVTLDCSVNTRRENPGVHPLQSEAGQHQRKTLGLVLQLVDAISGQNSSAAIVFNNL